MGLTDFLKALWGKSLRMMIFVVRIQAIIVSYIVTSVACILHGKEAVQEPREAEGMEEIYESCNGYLEKIDEHSEGDDDRFNYADAAIKAVDRFWSKAEDKVWEMANRRVPCETKMLLLDAIQESYNKLKYKLRDDLREQGVDLEERFEPLLGERNTKAAELRFLLTHSEKRCVVYVTSAKSPQDIQREEPLEENPPMCVGESLENQIESLTKVLSSADTLVKRPASSVHDMIPLLKDVQREVSEMLEYLEGCRPNFNPELLKNLSAEYQLEKSTL